MPEVETPRRDVSSGPIAASVSLIALRALGGMPQRAFLHCLSLIRICHLSGEQHRRLALGNKRKSKKEKKMSKKAKKRTKKLEKMQEGSDSKVDRRDTPPTSPFSS
jgi:hypothetical protein